MGKEIKWKGTESRKLSLQRPCECGCDGRDGKKGVGYLIGSDESGKGFTIWIKSEKVFKRLSKCLSLKND